MDKTRAIYNLPIHEHPLFPSARFVFGECNGCHIEESIYGGYFCYEPRCYAFFHKECANAPKEINHPSHSEHPLLLTNDYSGNGLCNCCGQNLLSPCYNCPTCGFKVDFICGIRPMMSVIEHPKCHDHPLEFLKKQDDHEVVACELCKESIGGPSYSCFQCHVSFHVDCVHLSKEVNHPCHCTHPLNLIASEALTEDDDVEKSCHFCLLKPEMMLFHCFICNFTMCLRCTKNPPPLVIKHTKTHIHPLRLFTSKIQFTCKVCGIKIYDTKPYICFDCDFIVHGDCIDLPRVININRHDHRITFTNYHGNKHIKCGVCRQSVSSYYGAYSCSVCANYAVHSRCAIMISVSDGIELEGTSETSEDIAPFKVVGDNLISHFSHDEKHSLRLYKDINVIHYYQFIRCEACIRPVHFGSIYSCEECLYVLHEKCANLPKKKKLVFNTTPYTLQWTEHLFYCNLCGVFSCGLMYTSHGLMMVHHYIDVHCGSIFEPFDHDGHLHPLYFNKLKNHYCDGCNKYLDDHMLRCESCNFDLCLYCATLPQKIWHRNDHEHPLILYYGRKASGEDWCDICENDISSNGWFFTCAICGVNVHVRCAIGDFSRMNIGMLILIGEKGYEVVLNNHHTRPLCSQCHSRCEVSVILKDDGEDNGYICSNSCLSSSSGVGFCTQSSTSRPALFGSKLYGE